MALVNVPIVNTTLVNANLIEKRKQFIINDCEMLRREFEVYGVDLSDAVLDMYRKALILYNANVVWDLRAVSIRQTYQQTYTNNTHKFVYGTPTTYQVPAGILSIDPITRSFMSDVEFKNLAEGHIKALFRWFSPQRSSDMTLATIFENFSTELNPFSLITYTQLEANYQAKYGAFNFSVFPFGPNAYNPTTNAPVQNNEYHEFFFAIQKIFQERSTYLVKLFQNPTLEMKSLIPEFKKMFALNPYQVNGIPYNPIYNFESIHFASVDKYFNPYSLTASNRMYANSNQLFLMGMKSLSNPFQPSSYTSGYTQNIATMNPTTDSEIASLQASYPYPATDQRSDYQKAFTYSSYSPDSASVALNKNTVAVMARRVEKNKEYITAKGGNTSIVQNLFWIIAEAHASVMTPINVLSLDYARTFKRSFVVTRTIYTYRQGTWNDYSYQTTTTKNTAYGTLVGEEVTVVKMYVLLNDNFRLKINGNIQPMWEGLKTISDAYPNTFEITIPLDITQPFPYYLIDAASSSKSHLIKSSSFLGIQKLRNGFLYQDIARNFDPTFINFDPTTIDKLESLASKQIAIYDILTDVKNGDIYTKAITTSEPKQPFNPYQPEYVNTTVYKDVIKTEQGEINVVHPEMGYECKWSQVHAELVLQSSFFYNQFMLAAQSTVDVYNNRVASYIMKLLNEMKTLSTTYVQDEADKLSLELAQTKLEVTLEKLKTGVFIDDQGREYWRPLLPEEQTAMNEMIATIQSNINQENVNKDIEIQNALAQKAIDEAQIKENDEAQRLADMDAIEKNIMYQKLVDEKAIQDNEDAQRLSDLKQMSRNNLIIEEDSQWKKDNVDNIVAPTISDIKIISEQNNNIILTEALKFWENAHPFYSYNDKLVLQIDQLRANITKAQNIAADQLIQYKLEQAGLVRALMSIFPDKF